MNQQTPMDSSTRKPVPKYHAFFGEKTNTLCGIKNPAPPILKSCAFFERHRYTEEIRGLLCSTCQERLPL